jgi:hypothetical protein
VSDAEIGVTSKFHRVYDGPWEITNINPPVVYEFPGKDGKRVVFNELALKPYLKD